MSTQEKDEVVGKASIHDLHLGGVAAEFSGRTNKDGFGDCIDCGECVLVCPMGIDIRNGTQLECVNCTACIDACDAVMEKIGKPKGLIRYTTYNIVTDNQKKIFNTRTIAYSIVLTVILSVFITLLALRSDTETTVLRQRGTLYQQLPNGMYSNIYEVKLINKTLQDKNIEVRLLSPKGELVNLGLPETLPGFESIEGRFIIKISEENLTGYQTELEFGVYENDKLVETATSGFLGPG